ncbi:MAG: ATP-binding protein [Acidimicrobiales bacterium]
MKESRPRLSLGVYHKAVESPLLMMALEPWVWTVFGLAGRPPHRRPHLVRTATVHSAHSAWMWWRVRRRPALVRSRRWMVTHGLLTLVRCGIYPAIAPRHSYWQGKADDAAFFMQAWTPMVLLGAAGSASIATPAAAAGAGFSVGLGVYVVSAVLNGERPATLNWTTARRVLNYSVSSATVGYVVHIIVSLLNDASDELASEQGEYRKHFEKGSWERNALDEAARESDSTLGMLERLQSAASRHFPDEAELEELVRGIEAVKDKFREASIPEWRPMDFTELAREASAELPLTLKVEPASLGMELRAEEVLVVRMFLKNAFGNAVDHGGATEAGCACELRADGTASVTVADNGRGPGPRARIRPGHGLARVQGILQNLNGDITIRNRDGGGAEVVACWSRPEG